MFWGWFCNLEICGGIEVVVVDDADDDNDEEVRDDVDDDDDDEVGGGFFFLVGFGLMVFFWVSGSGASHVLQLVKPGIRYHF